jgi:hypothetical protein
MRKWESQVAVIADERDPLPASAPVSAPEVEAPAAVSPPPVPGPIN